MKKTYKHPAVLIFFLALLSVNSQNVTLTNMVSSLSGEYEEHISMEISPWSGWVGLGFMFTNVSGPMDTSDFASEPSFVDIMILGTHSKVMIGGTLTEEKRTSIIVTLNTSEIESISQGRLKADILKTKFEDFFDITLPFSNNFTFGDIVTYSYRIDECPIIQRFREVFLEHKPSQGFGKIVTPELIGDYVAISFDLKRRGDSLEWWITATVNYPEHFKMNLGEEYTISLQELTGYLETVHASSESSNSTFYIGISQVDKDYKLIFLETDPDMEKVQGTYGAVTSFMFEKTITGSNVDDLLIYFKIVSPNYIDPTTIYMIVGTVVITVAIGIIVGFTIRKKRNTRNL